MRHLISTIMLLAVTQAQAAAFDPEVRSNFLRGCRENPNADAAQKVMLRKGCDCVLRTLESSVTQKRFLNLGTQPDKGKSVLGPIAQICLAGK